LGGGGGGATMNRPPLFKCLQKRKRLKKKNIRHGGREERLTIAREKIARLESLILLQKKGGEERRTLVRSPWPIPVTLDVWFWGIGMQTRKNSASTGSGSKTGGKAPPRCHERGFSLQKTWDVRGGILFQRFWGGRGRNAETDQARIEPLKKISARSNLRRGEGSKKGEGGGGKVGT